MKLSPPSKGTDGLLERFPFSVHKNLNPRNRMNFPRGAPPLSETSSVSFIIEEPSIDPYLGWRTVHVSAVAVNIRSIGPDIGFTPCAHRLPKPRRDFGNDMPAAIALGVFGIRVDNLHVNVF